MRAPSRSGFSGCGAQLQRLTIAAGGDLSHQADDDLSAAFVEHRGM
jgi:hypothetical protein